MRRLDGRNTILAIVSGKILYFVQYLLERLLTNWQGSSHTDVLRESL